MNCDREREHPAPRNPVCDDPADDDRYLDEVAQILARGVRRLLEGTPAPTPSEKLPAPLRRR